MLKPSDSRSSQLPTNRPESPSSPATSRVRVTSHLSGRVHVERDLRGDGISLIDLSLVFIGIPALNATLPSADVLRWLLRSVVLVIGFATLIPTIRM